MTTSRNSAKTRLIEARRLRRFTQRDVARRAAISASYLAELEKSGAAPSRDVRTRLARVLRFKVDELWPSTESAA